MIHGKRDLPQVDGGTLETVDRRIDLGGGVAPSNAWRSADVRSWWIPLKLVRACQLFIRLPESTARLRSTLSFASSSLAELVTLLLVGALLTVGVEVAAAAGTVVTTRSEEHTSELQSLRHLVC